MKRRINREIARLGTDARARDRRPERAADGTKQNPRSGSSHRVRNPRGRYGTRQPRTCHRALPRSPRRGQGARRVFSLYPPRRGRPPPPRPRPARTHSGDPFPMKIADEHISAIQSLGYAPDEARFLYIVATHSGYFMPRQFIACTGASWGKRSQTVYGETRKPRPRNMARVSGCGRRLSSLFEDALPPDRP